MSLVVQKYGGSSLASTEKIKKVAQRISEKRREGFNLIIVVSAMGKTTDELLSLAHEISPAPTRRELDMLLSVGERISMSLLSMALHQLGETSISFTGSQSGIVTDTSHTNARILEIRAERIQREMEQGKIVIVAGFQGVSRQREITTLGRGGSDVTAVALAVKLGADCCEFYKDVDGVYTKNPKVASAAKKLERCNYDQVLKLVEEGAEVFHPDAIHLAREHAMPLYLASTFDRGKGTHIQKESYV